MTEIAIDASPSLQWFLEDECDRGYSVSVLQRLSNDLAIVPILWFYEIGNGLTMACRRKRISLEQVDEYIANVPRMPIRADESVSSTILALCEIARRYDLTNYDAAYLELAMRRKIALATTDQALRVAAARAGVKLVP